MTRIVIYDVFDNDKIIKIFSGDPQQIYTQIHKVGEKYAEMSGAAAPKYNLYTIDELITQQEQIKKEITALTWNTMIKQLQWELEVVLDYR